MLQQSSTQNIKMAVRVCPTNKYEQAAQSKLCVQKVNDRLEITSGEEIFSFTYDYCLLSNENLRESKDQVEVYDGIGRDLLYQCFQGYNCCLLAYGQTGSGKSHTMFGTQSERGIVFRLCEDLFKYIQSSQIKYEVRVSIMELQKEKLYDRSFQSQNALLIREGVHMGVYIPDLQSYLVINYSDVEERIDKGIKYQLISNYQMGQITDGSTLIIQFELKQIINNCHRVSLIQFVDMEGSEMTKQETYNGPGKYEIRVKLRSATSALQEVTRNLCTNNKIRVRYRESKLTRILQNALGGNCKTYMICTISPSLMNYSETLSTLKFANRAMKIVNSASIYSYYCDAIIDIQFKELISLENDIQILLQQLLEKNQHSLYLLDQIKNLKRECE